FNYAETIDFVWEGNSYGNVRISTASPALLEVTRSSASNNWAADASEKMPLGCHALGVDNVTAHGPLRNGSGGVVYETPYVTPAQGPTNQRVDVRWSTAVEGTVQLKIRADRPV
ncbi:MAG: right-handed parallel beta-helix repeat-containing protein, partial [Pseudomonadota bacterium]